jgi:hypothetical protein
LSDRWFDLLCSRRVMSEYVGFLRIGSRPITKETSVDYEHTADNTNFMINELMVIQLIDMLYRGANKRHIQEKLPAL